MERIYHWYLVEKETVPQHEQQPGEWLLVCPDFPELCIPATIKNWNCAATFVKAYEMIKQKLSEGKISEPQKKIPEYLSFSVSTALDRIYW